MLKKRYLYSDMDGTLIGDDHQVSARNREAIHRFTQAGGRFSIATGRHRAILGPYLEDLEITAPAILFNGAGVYDLDAGRFLHTETLDPLLAGGIIATAHAFYPQSCPEVFLGEQMVLTNPQGMMDRYVLAEKQPFVFAPPRERYEDAVKLIVYGEHDRLEALRGELARRFGTQQYRTTYSAPFYLEILPPDASKGSALHWIEAHCGIAPEDTAAIGDYFNDVEMLRAASLGAAVGNAPDAVKAQADVVVADNNHDAVADFIERYLLED